MRLYHLSFGTKVSSVKPNIPKSRLAGENSETPRICAAKTLDDCLTGIGLYRPFMYTLVGLLKCGSHDRDIQMPFTVRTYSIPEDFPEYVDNSALRGEVPDAVLSGECWLTKYVEPDDTRLLWLKDAKIEYVQFLDNQDIQYPCVKDSIWSEKPCSISEQLYKELASDTMSILNHYKKGSEENMLTADKRYIESLRTQYPAGTRLKLIKQLDDPYMQIPAGECCTVRCVDDIGTIHVAWDCGSSLGLIPEEDCFAKL